VTDYSAILRTRFTTTARALRIAADPNAGIETGSPITSVGLQSGGVLLELFQQGDDIWIPDWTSLREFAVSPGTAAVFCNVEERLCAEPPFSAEEREVFRARDPRSILQRTLSKAKAEHGVDFLVGFEIEFLLVASPSATEPLPSPKQLWGSASTRKEHWTTVVEASVTALEAAGVGVWTFNPEDTNSKYEISLSPLPPLEAVDALQYAHEVIKTLAQKAGVHATMHAKAFETGPTVGKHIHLSLSKPQYGTSFLAGVLKHYPALCALMMANLDSYGVREGQFGGGPVGWGWKNKLMCVKRIEEAYYELRPPDSFANMYLVLAGIIGVGLRGVEDGEELESLSFDEIVMAEPPTEEQRKRYGIKRDVPKGFKEALEEFRGDDVLKDVLGEECFERYLYNKEKDLDASKKMSSAERRKVLMEAH